MGPSGSFNSTNNGFIALISFDKRHPIELLCIYMNVQRDRKTPPAIIFLIIIGIMMRSIEKSHTLLLHEMQLDYSHQQFSCQ